MQCADSLLQLTRMFWNANPCDGQSDVARRMEFRYGKEPWLPPVLDRIARHRSILEVGCGQGTDALYCCRLMDTGGSYVGVDYSDRSVASAGRSLQQYRDHLRVVPEFRVGNAERLEFEDHRFDCVTSIGVLHHTPKTKEAIDEVYRVLRPGGTAVIALYRLLSPKVLTAKAIRLAARGVDLVAGADRTLYRACARLGSDHAMGTMLLECLGVPLLKSYTRGQIVRMFAAFDDVRISPVGMGLPSVIVPARVLRRIDRGPNPFGTLWLIEARKPVVGADGRRADGG
jgi:SAM-dependent methyltransferase